MHAAAKPIMAAALMKSPTRDGRSRSAGAAVGTRLSSGPGIIYFMTPGGDEFLNLLPFMGRPSSRPRLLLVPHAVAAASSLPSDNMSTFPGQSLLRGHSFGRLVPVSHCWQHFLSFSGPRGRLHSELFRILNSPAVKLRVQYHASRPSSGLNSWTQTSEKSASHGRWSVQSFRPSRRAALGRRHAPRRHGRPAVLTMVS